jgi:ubiquinone/menaquinone biosynthesis C-methylase UbiE
MNIENLSPEDLQKQKAIDTHSEQAELFANRYKIIEQNPYQDSFVYSRKRLNEWLDRYMPNDGHGLNLVDIGCGTGYHLERYKERGFEITGVDGSEEMLKQARIVNPEIEFIQSDVDLTPLPAGKYDFALCIEVLRYLPDIAPCIKEIKRILKPNGTALITAAPVFQANLYPIVNKIALAGKSGDLTQLRQYFHSIGELRRVCLKAGFKDVEIHGVYGGCSIWLERISPSSMPSFLKFWEKIDSKTADAPILKNLSNMFLIVAKG